MRAIVLRAVMALTGLLTLAGCGTQVPSGGPAGAHDGGAPLQDGAVTPDGALPDGASTPDTGPSGTCGPQPSSPKEDGGTSSSDNAIVTWSTATQAVGSGNGNFPSVTDANGDTWTFKTSGVWPTPQFSYDNGARLYKNGAIYGTTQAPFGTIILRDIPRRIALIRPDIPGAYMGPPDPSGTGGSMIFPTFAPAQAGTMSSGDFFPPNPWDAAFPSPDDSRMVWDDTTKAASTSHAPYLREADGSYWEMKFDPSFPLFPGDQGCRLYYCGQLLTQSAGWPIVDVVIRYKQALAFFSVAGSPPTYFVPNGTGGTSVWGPLDGLPPTLAPGTSNNGNGSGISTLPNWSARTLDLQSSPAPGASGTTLTAGPGGTYSTVAAAIAAANPGDTVRLMPGTPPETLNINTPITLDGNMNWWDFTNWPDSGTLAGWSGGHPYSGFGAIVPGTVRSLPFAAPTQWAPNTAYSATATLTNGNNSFTNPTAVVNGANTYIVVTPGTSASSGGPTGTGASITDGTAVWQYVQTYQSAVIKNFILSGVGLDYQGFSSVGAIRANSEGLLTVDNVAFIGNQVGLDYSNYYNSSLTVTNSAFLDNGLAYSTPASSTPPSTDHGYGGNSHNMYITDIAQLTLTRVVTTRPIEARPIKFRGNRLMLSDVITGSQHGGALNYPNGGFLTVGGTGGSIWNIPPSASNSKQVMTYADEQYEGTDAVYSVDSCNLISNTAISIQNPIANFNYVAPYYAVLTFDGTNTWYNSNVPSVPTDGPAPRVVGVPTATTGTTMTPAQWNAALAIDTAEMIAPATSAYASNASPIKTLAYLAAYLEYYDVQLPPWQAAPIVTGTVGPPAGDTITVTSHPDFSGTHGTPYCAVATPLAAFSNSNGGLQNVQYMVTVDWGDSTPALPDNILAATGGTSNGQGVTTGPTLTLYGAHTYAKAGNYTVKVTVAELSPGTATASTTLTATIL